MSMRFICCLGSITTLGSIQLILLVLPFDAVDAFVLPLADVGKIWVGRHDNSRRTELLSSRCGKINHDDDKSVDESVGKLRVCFEWDHGIQHWCAEDHESVGISRVGFRLDTGT